MNSKDARVPVVYKLNASYTHFFSDRLRVGISAYANWARHNYMYVDRNMVDEPYFRIAAEGIVACSSPPRVSIPRTERPTGCKDVKVIR